MNINNSLARPALVLVLAGALAGCGGASTLDAASQAALHGEVQQLRSAAARDDRAAAVRELAQFRAAVQGLLDQGGIDPADAAALLAQAEGIAAALPAPAPARTEPEKAPAQPAKAQAQPAVAAATTTRTQARPQQRAVTAPAARKAVAKHGRKHDGDRARWWKSVQREWLDREGDDDD